MEKQIYISELKKYFTQSIEQPFYLKDIIQKESSENKKPYMDLLLIDRSGSVNAKIWEENISNEYLNYKSRVVAVRALVTQDTNENITLFITHLSLVEKYQESDYINGIACEKQESYKALFVKYADMVTHKGFQCLLQFIIKNDLDTMAVLPASLKGNGNYNGGLLVYTICTTSMAYLMMKCLGTYNIHPDYTFSYQAELLITAALLHRVGVIKILKPYPDAERLKESPLLDVREHTLTFLTQRIVNGGIDLAEKDQSLLFHLICCTYEDSSIKPMIREGLLLQAASRLNTSVCRLEYFLHKNENEQGSIFDETLKNYLYIFSE